MQNVFGPLNLLGLVLLGIALLWVLPLAYGSGRIKTDDTLRLVLNIAGWVMIIVGIIGATVQVLSILSPFAFVLILGILAMVVTRYRSLEGRSLLWTLSVAARKGIPLDEAAEAFALERSDEIGLRAQRLAEFLRSGVPLPEALERSRTRLPTDTLVAVRLGTETGNLSAAMRCTTRLDDEFDFLLRAIFEKYFYLGLILLVAVNLATFMMLKIVPVFARMFEEFELPLPHATQMLIFGSDLFVEYWFFTLPFLFLVLGLLLIGALYYVGLAPRNLPVANWLSRRMDGATVMRVLALAVEQQWSIAQTVWALARLYPKSSIRNRLQSAGEQINGGEHWCDSLSAVGLIHATDAAVLRAAESVGNLDWALREMADSAVRRLSYWLRFWLNVLFPLVLLVVGTLVGFFAIGLFLPLIALIQGLV